MTKDLPVEWKEQFPFIIEPKHKYARGHVLVYGGYPAVGAAQLSAVAALRVGAGIATLSCPRENLSAFAGYKAALLLKERKRPTDFIAAASDSKVNVVVVGPGAGQKDMVRVVLGLCKTQTPAVFDADALTAFEGHQGQLLEALGPNDVITPHTGEFSRIFPDIDLANPEEAALRAAQRTECTVVLKSQEGTYAASPQGQIIQPHNRPAWIGTAGAGDALTGLIAGLMAQGLPPFKAAATALWIGNEAAKSFGPGMIADDIVETIPAVLKKLYDNKE